VVTLFSLICHLAVAMASRSGSRSSPEEEARVASLLESLNLTNAEGEFVAFSDDEEDDVVGSQKGALIGKVLSPTALHINTITAASQPGVTHMALRYDLLVRRRKICSLPILGAPRLKSER
jgi:hypothetical protein